MQIRLRGAAEECAAAAALISTALEVLDASPPYPDRPPSRLVRVYLTVTAPQPPQPPAAGGDPR